MTDLSDRQPLGDFGGVFSSMMKHYEQWAKQQSLGLNTILVLYMVARREHCSQREIASEYSLPKQTVFNICSQLTQQGYLRTEPSRTDKRGKWLMLTEAGKAYALPMAEKLTALENRAANEFGVKDLGRLLADLHALERIFAAVMAGEKAENNADE